MDDTLTFGNTLTCINLILKLNSHSKKWELFFFSYEYSQYYSYKNNILAIMNVIIF